MANNSLTQRVLSAVERGLTNQEISCYENIPLEDVEKIIRYWDSNFTADSTARQNAARKWLRNRNPDRIHELVDRWTAEAKMERRNVDVRRYVTLELADHYHIDAVLAGDVVEEVYLAMDNVRSERSVRRRDLAGVVGRMWQ